MPIELNELETRRFGVVCGHVTDPCASPEEIDLAACRMGVAMLTIRLSSRKLEIVHALEMNGFRLMDTLVVYSSRLADIPEDAEGPEGVTTSLARASDADAIERIAREAFSNYLGHYHSDPRLDQTAATDAYVDWARRSIETPPAGVGTLIACKDGTAIGFLTFRMNTDREGEVLLNGVSSYYRQIGVNRYMLSRVQRIMIDSGRSSLLTSTQVTNAAAQRVWVRRGFLPEYSFYTLHKWYSV